jgi:hypothetical protein
MLHGIESIFPPPSQSGHKDGNHPISEKKAAKGAGSWTIKKVALGWKLDGEARTISLPPGKAADCIEYTETMLEKCVAPLNSYRKATGKLRRATYIIVGAIGMFTPINMAMKGNPKFVGIGKSSAARAAFKDLIVLVKQVAQRPTHVREIFYTIIDYGGYCDACGTGIGGVFFPLDSHAEYTAFRLQLPTDIQKHFHAGIVTMGDLELAAALLLTMMLKHAVLALKHKTIAAWSDNTPTMGWVWRMATKQSKIAGRLIRGLGLRQRMNETCPLAAQHIPGEKNKMADFASRSYTPSLHLHGDSHFFARFSHLSPLPQNLYWTIALPPKEITSLIFSTLGGKLQPLELWTTQLVRNIGDIGNNMQDASTLIPT